jgi:hypothetical protein
MKYLKKYNENVKELRRIDLDMIEACFAYAFDLTVDKEIYEVYADPTKKYDFKPRQEGDYYDFFANIGRQDSYIEGYQINFETNFYDKSSLKDFTDYLELLDKINEGIHKLKEIYKVDIIQFDGVSNSIVCLQIAYNDIKLVADL